jgi:hypothetical protein
MTTAAWLMMIPTMGIITAFTLYFFKKILTTPHLSESDEK